MDLGLQGKVAVVTGGSEGIGKATAASMAIEGASLVIAARRADVLNAAADEIRFETGGTVTAIPTDVMDPAQVKALIDATVRTYGGLDILVNNAGISAAGPFEGATDDDWQRDLDLKLYGAIRASRLALPLMRRRGGGRIINVTNIGARAPGAESVPTSVSRAAGVALTKAMSKEFAGDNILVNTVCIGSIKSGQTQRWLEWMHEDDPKLTIDQIYDDIGASVPLGRIGEAEEAGDVIAFLASDRASYLTGIAVNIDGGVSPVV